MQKHNHSTKPNFKRIHPRRDSYMAYQPGVRRCEECRKAADAKNSELKQAAHDAFLKKNRLV